MNTEIINRALIKLGESPISSTNESPLGKTLEIVYEEVRLLLLSSYPWRFAIKRAELAPLEDKEIMNPRFKYKFIIPSDYITLRKVGVLNKASDLRDFRYDNGTQYEVEGKYIYSNEKLLHISYIADVDESFYSNNFKELMANKIAAELSVKLHQNLNLVSLYEQKAQSALDTAITHNEIIADTEELPENTWLEIRTGWRYGY
jgi:hypothetical protein